MSKSQKKLARLLQTLADRKSAQGLLMPFFSGDKGLGKALGEQFVDTVFTEVWRGFIRPTRDGHKRAASRLGIALTPAMEKGCTVSERGADAEGEHVLLQARKEFRGLLQWGSFVPVMISGKQSPLRELYWKGRCLIPAGIDTLLPAAYHLGSQFPKATLVVNGEWLHDGLPALHIGKKLLGHYAGKRCMGEQFMLFRHPRKQQEKIPWEPHVLSVQKSFGWNGKTIVDRLEVEGRVIDLDGTDLHEVTWNLVSGDTRLHIHQERLHIDLGYETIVRNVIMTNEAKRQWSLRPCRTEGTDPNTAYIHEVCAEEASGFAHAMSINHHGRRIVYRTYSRTGELVYQFETKKRWKIS